MLAGALKADHMSMVVDVTDVQKIKDTPQEEADVFDVVGAVILGILFLLDANVPPVFWVFGVDIVVKKGILVFVVADHVMSMTQDHIDV